MMNLSAHARAAALKSLTVSFQQLRSKDVVDFSTKIQLGSCLELISFILTALAVN